MITAYISAGSSSIVQDIINGAQALHNPISDWQGYVYNSTTGNKPWCVWLQRMDEDAHELQYVSSSGLAAPPDAYEKITVSCPTTTGFSISFTTVNTMPTVIQTKGVGSGGAGGGGGNVVTIRMSGAATNAVSDLMTVASNTFVNANFARDKVYYNSSAGSQPWQAYIICHTYGTSNMPGAMFIFTIGGVASPEAGSEQKAVSCPTTTLNSNSFTQIGGPLSVGAR